MIFSSPGELKIVVKSICTDETVQILTKTFRKSRSLLLPLVAWSPLETELKRLLKVADEGRKLFVRFVIFSFCSVFLINRI